MSAGGFDLTTVLERWQLGDVLQSRPAPWGTNNHVHLVDVPGMRVVVRIYQNLDESQVAGEHRVLAALAAVDLPYLVPRPLTTPEGSTWVATPHGPAAVFTRLPGERPLPTLDALEHVGEAFGDLDQALATLDPTLAAHDWRRSLAATHPAVTDLTPLLDATELDGLHAALLRSAPVQLVHQDLALSNTLFLDGKVSALLDFELVGLGLRAIDLVAGFVQTGCLDPADEPLARASALLRGYGRAVRLTEEEIVALPGLLRFRRAGAAVWRYGRFLRGQANREDVRVRVEELRETERWVEEFGDELVEVARRVCGSASLG